MVKELWRGLQLNIQVHESNKVAISLNTLTSSGYPEEPSAAFGPFFSFCFLSVVVPACSKAGICAGCNDGCAIDDVLVNFNGILDDAGQRCRRTVIRWI